MIDLSVVIVSFNTKDLLRDCLSSLLKHTKSVSYEIIIVDNGSTDGSIAAIQKFQIPPRSGLFNSKFQIIKNNKNLGFAKANNQGFKASKGKYVLFLNSDTKVGGNVLGDMIAWMDNNPKVGISTCMLKNSDGTIQATGGYFPTPLSAFSWMTIQDLPFVDNFIKPFHPMKGKSFQKGGNYYKNERELDWVTGAFLLIRKEILDKIGGWDEDYFMYMEEVDLCFRVKKLGWRVYYVPAWSITHLGGASSSTEFTVLSEYKGIKIFYKKHFPAWHYSLLRFFLKLGALGRIFLFGIIEGKETAKIYAKAFRIA